MNSNFLKLNIQDLSRGLVVAVLAAIFTSLALMLNSPDFSFATFEYGEVLRIAIITALSYLSKNLLSDESGKVLGKIG